MAKVFEKKKLWQGLAGLFIFLCVFLVSATILANSYEGLVNDVLGLNARLMLKGSSYSMDDKGYEELIEDSYAYCIKQVEEGSVLLKNNGALPLAADERNVTLFGNNGAHTIYRSGAGGPTTNSKYEINLGRAFREGGFKINEKLYSAYENSGKQWALNQNGSTTVGEVDQNFYTDELKNTFDTYKDAAIITFARYGTENADPSRNINGRGYLEISKDEEDLLKMINDSGKFDKKIVLLNGVLPMELDFLDEYDIDACLWFGNPGYYGLPGVVNILTGKANPSGRTVQTFANNTLNAPAMRNFGNYEFDFTGFNKIDSTYGSKYVVYKEGIYVGYKYYETRYEDIILGQGNADGDAGAIGEGTDGAKWDYAEEVSFPFGFGLSYSTYTQKLNSVTYNADDDTYTANVTVTNTNDTAGKEVVEVYVQAPYTAGGLEKASVSLVGYTKVDVAANGSETVDVTFDRYHMASYDVNGNDGKGSYVLEAGDYYFAIGNGAHDALNNILAAKDKSGLIDHDGKAVTGNKECAKKETLEADTTSYINSVHNDDVAVENKFEDADWNYWSDEDQKIEYLTRNNWQGTFPASTTGLRVNQNIVTALDMKKYTTDGDSETYSEMLDAGKVDALLDEQIDFIDMKDVPYDDPKWDKFLSQMSLEDLVISINDARSIQSVSTINKPSNSIAEGPEGLLAKFKLGDQRNATGFATLPTTTATWDHKMQAEYGTRIGEEALFCGVAMVNAPGCNIMRTAYTSRGSEYMSEDAILSSYSVSNILSAMRDKGLICNVKHCFLNNQETNRQGVATFANEQSIREIYLKPFEGALTRGRSLGIMTSYNRIGLTYAACHATLMQDVMRGEWKYEGTIIDDALTASANYSVGPDMLNAGTNIFCLDGRRGDEIIRFIDANDDGDLVKKLQESNKRTFYSLLQGSMGNSIDSGSKFGNELMWWQQLLISIDVIFGVAALGAIVMYVLSVYVFGRKREKATADNATSNETEENPDQKGE